jgi:SAM-dependent methyltransferase
VSSESNTPNIDRYIPVNEDGYFIFDQQQITDPEAGKPLLEAIRSDDMGRFTTEMNGQKAWVEYFDEPIVARHFEPGTADKGNLQLCYGAKASFSYDSLTVDEWDRFHGITDKGLPFVFSRPAQVEFFNALDEFDDESITVGGHKHEVGSWLPPSSETPQIAFWSEHYKRGDTPWDQSKEHPALANVLPQLKLSRCRVLVLGCGNGHDAAFFAKQGHFVTAVDFSAEAIQKAKQLYGSLDNLKIVQGDAFLPPPTWLGNFDVVFEHTLYCAISPDQRNDLVKTWSKLLTPQGHLFGVFFSFNKPKGPPFGGSEWEVRQRLSKYFEPLYWTRWRHSKENRQGIEFVVYARKKS